MESRGDSASSRSVLTGHDPRACIWVFTVSTRKSAMCSTRWQWKRRSLSAKMEAIARRLPFIVDIHVSLPGATKCYEPNIEHDIFRSKLIFQWKLYLLWLCYYIIQRKYDIISKRMIQRKHDICRIVVCVLRR
ncbi:hypothetical protein K1719_042229 [Acacia pycnantha]|nr:hypothetical protein K1719_042229 [Acacia pycnantha]